jgi:hypothetical protein
MLHFNRYSYIYLVILYILQVIAFAQVSHAPVAQPSYSGKLRLPVRIATGGLELTPGAYDVHVRPAESTFILELASGGKVKLTLRPVARDGEAAIGQDPVLLTPTQYLRSSAEPVLTAEERHFSKSGRAQYEEEARDWKATLRCYKNPDEGSVFLVFEEKQTDGRWRRVTFRMAAIQSPTR